MLPIESRAAVHFTYGFLDLSVGMVEASTGFGLPLGTDTIVKFGGAKGKQQVAPSGEATAFPRPNMTASFVTHIVFCVWNFTLGALALVV